MKRLKPLFHGCAIAVMTYLITGTGVLSAYGQSSSQPSSNLGEILSDLIHNTVTALNRQLENIKEFAGEFDVFKQSADSRFNGIQARLETIIKDFADHSGGLLESSRQLTQDLEGFSRDLNKIPEDYPRFTQVRKILEPLVDQFARTIKEQFPVLGPTPLTGNPLGNIYQFYQGAEQRNSLGMGSIFKIEPLKSQARRKILQEKIQESILGGIFEEKVIFRDIRKFQNDELVFHQVIENGKVVLETSKAEDFSLLHGLPLQLRQDRVDDRVVRLIEEYINIVNYHIQKNIRENGLEIPEHPQLAVPAGYSPVIFVRNFIGIMISLKPPEDLEKIHTQVVSS